MHIYRSAKTGKIVTEKYAKANPDLVVKEKVKKAVEKKAVEKPKVEKPVEKAVEKVVEPPRYTPMIGEWCEMSGKLITIQNFDPFEAKEWYVMDNVICDRPFTTPDFENVRPVSAEERYARLR